MCPNRLRVMLVAVTTAVALTGCGGGDVETVTTSASAPAAPAAPVTVEIVNYKFATPEVAVQVGGSVSWVNKDDFEHTATAADNKFDTKKLSKGASGKVTFDTAGTFDYICDIHQYMTGKVIVT